MNGIERYRPHWWIEGRIEIRPSPFHGRGMFASEQVREGEVAVVWGGTLILTNADVDGEPRKHWRGLGYVWARIGEDAHLAEQLGGNEDLTNLMNHSCDPTVWFADEVTLVARRDIAVYEELTLDYALFEGDEEMVCAWECRCGSPLCRGGFTGRDWRIPDLQARYGDHFSPFINRRILSQHANDATACEHRERGASSRARRPGPG